MNTLHDWARQYPEAAAALAALHHAQATHTPAEFAGFTEKAVAQRVRAAAYNSGAVLWRNNVGALLDSRGVPVRYGLMNETPAMNDRYKSPDLIGIRPVIITPSHVGTVIGQFIGRETKAAGWRFSGNAHETAQQSAIDIINLYGGDAKFTTGEF